jgi:hypothetical protein
MIEREASNLTKVRLSRVLMVMRVLKEAGRGLALSPSSDAVGL